MLKIISTLTIIDDNGQELIPLSSATDLCDGTRQNLTVADAQRAITAIDASQGRLLVGATVTLHDAIKAARLAAA